LSSCGQVQSPQQNIFFLCAPGGEGFLPERTVNLPNHALLPLRGAHNPGVNIIPTQSHGTHRILRKVIAQLKFRIFQKSCKFPPKRERVLASLAECAGRQCNGLRCLDLATNILEKRLGCFLTPNMARCSSQRFASSLSNGFRALLPQKLWYGINLASFLLSPPR
jgi:hypothetical protein